MQGTLRIVLRGHSRPVATGWGAPGTPGPTIQRA